jgi:signal peptidase I
MLAGCSQYPLVPLEVSSYGYEMGDIVLTDTKKTPEIGDLVLYDTNVKRSHCMAFGPGVYLAKVIGLPGDNVRFSQCSYEANGCIGSFECGPAYGQELSPPCGEPADMRT